MLRIEQDWLPAVWAKELQANLLDLVPQPEVWSRYDNPFEQKSVLKDSAYTQIVDDAIVNMYHLNWDVTAALGQPASPDDGQYTAVFHYGVGDYLRMHKDAYRAPGNGRRKLATAILYLSTEDTWGSALQIWTNDEKTGLPDRQRVLIEPHFNTLVMFDDCWHGNPVPVVKGHRLAITVSFLGAQVNSGYERAYFAPLPFETWTPKMYELRDLRADPEKYASIYQVR